MREGGGCSRGTPPVETTDLESITLVEQWVHAPFDGVLLVYVVYVVIYDNG